MVAKASVEDKRYPKRTKGTEKPVHRKRISLYPLSLETALGAAIATGPIPVEDRKPKPKKKVR
jgi:hypothetical protein